MTAARKDGQDQSWRGTLIPHIICGGRNPLFPLAPNLMRNVLVNVAVGLAFLAGPADGLLGQQPKRDSDLARYAAAVVTALGAAHRGAVKPDTAAGGNVMLLATEGFYASARQRRGMEDAVAVLSPYANDADSAIRETTDQMVFAFDILRDASLSADSLLRSQLDRPESIATGTIAHRMAELRTQRHDGATLLSLSVAGLADALTEPDPATSAARLSLTTSQRDAVLRTIAREFPDGVRANSDGRYASDYAAAVSLLDSFLRQQWRTR